MSKKYDNNLQEIKNTIPIKTFSTNSMEIEEDKENSIYKLTTTFLTQFYDAKEKYLIDSLLQDMQENKEKYKGLTIIPVEREKVVELLNKGKDFDQLQQQLAEKDKEISMLKSQNQFFMEETKRLDQISNLKDQEIEELKFQIEDKKGGCELCEFSKELRDIDIRHQICEEIRDELFNTEFKKAINDLGKIWLLNLLDQIEKGK